MVILDTCAIIELGKSEQSLSSKTIDKIQQSAAILTISFVEIACKVKAGKLILPISAKQIYQEFQEMSGIEIISPLMEDWFESVELNWPDNRDPADRLIVAHALKHALFIVSSDKKIKKFYKKVIW